MNEIVIDILNDIIDAIIEKEIIEKDIIENAIMEKEKEDEHEKENAIIENAIIENAIVENAIIENAIIENAIIENAIVENAIIEKEIVENAIIEKEIIEKEIVENAIIEKEIVNEIVNKHEKKKDKFSIIIYAFEMAKKYNVNYKLVLHIINKETGNLKDKINAVSSSGAQGVMQLMPSTAKELGVNNPFDAKENIEGGVRYLARLVKKYGNMKFAAMAYNWGPGNTDKWIKNGEKKELIPRETLHYIYNLKI